MKTFRMIGMALFAVLMCVNFTSCSSEDEDEVEIPEDFSIIGTWKMIEGDMDSWTITFLEDGTGYERWTDGGYTGDSTFDYRLDLENLKLYTQYPDEAPRIWEFVKITNTEATMLYSIIDEESGQKYNLTFVFRKQ